MNEVTKPGYKQTELGWIPEDWEILRFGEICSPSKVKMNPLNSESQKCIELENLSQGTGRILGVSDSKDSLSLKTVFLKGDVLLGKLRPYLRKYFFADFEGVCSTEIWVLKSQKNISNRFTFYLAQSDKIIEAANLSTGTKMPRAEWKTVSEKLIPVPPTLSEQTAIATALSDMDSYIGSLEKLIAKKRMIKQGVMQELLTPKEDWEVKKLNSVCWFQEGPGLRNWQFTKSGMKVVNVTNLENGKLNLARTDRHVSQEEFNKMYKHFEIDEKDILMASSGNSYSKVAVTSKVDLPLLMNTSVIRFKPLKDFDYDFLLIFLKSNSFKSQIDLLITGGAQPNFGPFHLNKIEIDTPKTISEQHRISSILMSLESEQNALVEKLSKARQFKQGMMQELLTGRTRII